MKRTRKRGELSLFRRATVALAVVLGLVFGAGVAWATSFDYVTTTNPMAGLTAYYSAFQNHTGNYIHQCQNPTFPAAIYLTTSGGTQIRRVDGNCPLANIGHPAENSTRAWCANKASTSKYAKCTEYY
jgi:hypothetical protein